jgi:hypothetical protein
LIVSLQKRQSTSSAHGPVSDRIMSNKEPHPITTALLLLLLFFLLITVFVDSCSLVIAVLEGFRYI